MVDFKYHTNIIHHEMKNLKRKKITIVTYILFFIF